MKIIVTKTKGLLHRRSRIVVTLAYEVTGNAQAALNSLRDAYKPRQGRLESVSGCDPGGSYEARCEYHTVAASGPVDEFEYETTRG